MHESAHHGALHSPQVRDVDHADTVYDAFDSFELRFSMPTNRGLLPAFQGDKRWVDRYFDFSCGLGLDYSGAWNEPERVVITILDGSPGVNPSALTQSQLGTMRVTPSREARFRNRYLMTSPEDLP